MTHSLFIHRTKNEKEVWRRIMVSVWAYAYEIENNSVVSNERFDREAKLINPEINTNRPDLDHFFRTEFHPDTGMWIHNHPDLEFIKCIYERFC